MIVVVVYSKIGAVMIRLFILMMLAASCKTSVFSGKKKSNPAPNPPAEELVNPKDKDTEEGGEIQVPGKNPDPTPDPGPGKTPGQSDESVFKLDITKMPHDALFKNCLYVKLNDGGFEEIACNKNFALDNKVIYNKVFDKDVCIEVAFKIDTFRPTDVETCSKAIQNDTSENKTNHTCDYESAAFRSITYGPADEDRFRVVSKIEDQDKHFEFQFEDNVHRDSDDWDDFVFRVDLREVNMFKMSEFDYCN